jgi:uncharacterized protein YjiS (DUF1127 family)
MQTTLHTLCLPRHLILSRLFEQWLRDAGLRLQRWHAPARKRRHDRDMLMSLRGLDDRTLHDIGFHRSEIAATAAIAGHPINPDRARVMRSVFGPSI